MAVGQEAALRRISEALSSQTVVPVIGAGVSMGAAGLPSWAGAFDSALEHLGGTRAVDDETLREITALQESDGLVVAFTRVVDLLKTHNELGAWLRDTFRREERDVTDWSLLSAVQELVCPVVATTNYDRLLSDFDRLRTRVPASWDEPERMLQVLRDGGGVLHLHGIYDRPLSVVLGAEDYASLARQAAYESVFRTLWMDRTLLFIGCSFDGLRDPDFTSLFDWATETFEQPTVRHYALLRSSDISTDTAAHLLSRRVQVVDYGEEYEDLPTLLRSINPRSEQVVLERGDRIRALIERHDRDDVAVLAQLLRDLFGDPAPSVDVSEEARTILETRQRSADEARQQLMSLQRIARDLIGNEDLGAVLRAVDSRPRAEELRAVWPSVLKALQALNLFPQPLLAQLRQRKVKIHDGVFNGQIMMWAGMLDKELRRGTYQTPNSAYKVENVARGLRSLLAVLESDAITLFPALAKGIGMTPSGPCLVVAWDDRIDLRPLDDVAHPVAVLSSTGTPQRVQVVHTPGVPTLVSHGADAVLWWQPHRSLEPSGAFQVDEPGGITSVTHRATPQGLVTYVATKRSVTVLVDARPSGAVPLPAYHSLGRFAALPDGTLLARDAGDDSLVSITQDGEVATIVDPGQLLASLVGLGHLPLDVRKVHIWGVLVTTVEERPLVVLEIGVDRRVGDRWAYEAAAVVHRPDDLTTPTATFHTPQQAQLFSTRVVPIGAQRCRVIAGSLPDPLAEGGPLVVRSSVLELNGSRTLLLPDGELLRTDDFRVSVAMRDADRGWAGAGRSLWRLDFAADSCERVVEDESAGILALDLLPGTRDG